MKKIIFISLFLILIAGPVFALWDDCPYGEVDCPYPGDCSRYIDTNKDEICDHSQLVPEDIIEIDTKERKYLFLPLAIFLIVIYLVTHILSKKKIISIAGHRKFWNVLLLLTFLGAGLSGIFLVLRINMGIDVGWAFKVFSH